MNDSGTPECGIYPFGTLDNYVFADAIARYKGKWIFCKPRKRDTWENPGGHIEPDETPLEAAKRELYEETGAVAFDLEPLCDYYAVFNRNGEIFEGGGAVFIAYVSELGDLPPFEMERIGFFDSPPENMTYPEFTEFILPLAVEKVKSL